MRTDTRLEVVLNGVRWANNILTEIVSNHGSVLPPDARVCLMTALREIGTAVDAIRRVQE